MSFINSIIKAFVGDKSQKDVKVLQPYLTKIKTFESGLIALSNDELRARTVFFKEKIKQALTGNGEKEKQAMSDVMHHTWERRAERIKNDYLVKRGVLL